MIKKITKLKLDKHIVTVVFVLQILNKLLNIRKNQYRDYRKLASRFLCGNGIEIGAGHNPVQVDPSCDVKYVDKLSSKEFRDAFPELPDPRITEADIIADVAKDGLRVIADSSVDFIIASHILEHLPDPLGFLKECYRVLRNEGVIYLAIPDKNFTFDKDRERTKLEHIIKDFRNGVINVDEEHLIDFLKFAARMKIPDSKEERSSLFNKELYRSIHVHIWTWGDCVEFIRFLIANEGFLVELCDMYLPGSKKIEVIFILRKLNNISVYKAITHFDSNLDVLREREMRS
ncbi:putative S-adenosylmethionine-dependent methyltransferase [uncultured bacterium]|nr:putative S-adenosylmethionine-dependent methyltransferase [uncultured bacterium]